MNKSVIAISCASLIVLGCGSSANPKDGAKSANSPADSSAAGASSSNTSSHDAGATDDSHASAGHAGATQSSAAGKTGSSGTSATMNGAAGAAGTASDAGAASATLSDLPDVFADAICGALLDCLGQSALRELTDSEPCAARIAGQLRATEFAYMDAAVASGHVAFDPQMISACSDGIRALGCDVLSRAYPAACSQVLAGKVEHDAECAISAECTGASYCAGAEQCPSHCAARLSEGDDCTGDNQCGDDLTCSKGSCVKLSLAGDACGGTSGKTCRLGLACQGSTDVQVGHCVENAMIQVGAAGASCEPGGTLCKDGLSCVYDGKSAFHCEAAVASGGKCHLGLPGQCPVGEFCDTTEITAQSTCKALPAAGKPCAVSNACAPGLACMNEAGAHVCRMIADNCGACSGPAACRSGRCEQGKCLPPAACGEESSCK